MKAVIFKAVDEKTRNALLDAGAAFDYVTVKDGMYTNSCFFITKCNPKKLQKIILKSGVNYYYVVGKNNEVLMKQKDGYEFKVANQVKRNVYNAHECLFYIKVMDGSNFVYFT
jgi:hypothetical protein